MKNLQILVAIIAAVMVYVTSRLACKDTIFGNRGLLVCVALLSFIGLLQLGEADILALLIPYQALAIAIFVTCIVCALSLPFRHRNDRNNRGRPDAEKRGIPQ